MGKEEERFHHLCFTRASLGRRGAVKNGLPPFYGRRSRRGVCGGVKDDVKGSAREKITYRPTGRVWKRERRAPAIQRHDTGQTEFLMGRSVIHGSTKSIVYDRGAGSWTPSKLFYGVDRCCSTAYDSIVIRKSILASRGILWGTRCSRHHEKRTLQYDPVFAASAETANSRRAAHRLRSEDELVLLICLTKRFRFFVNTANIGGFWYTRRERLRKKENSYVMVLLFPLTTKAVYLVPADEYLIGRISVARCIPPTRLCGGQVVFMRDESVICEIPRIKGEPPVSKGDNARARTVLLKRL
ncbi:Uncharacterized protein DBV15_09639 [Temnothorax longispinosus]|uniref:Uncharacterized protein n=1 Tax=Temnothorax longispinosus TaxID=300112 RepID=A0A4S2KNI7_9HYME|nr:Uncharacterized protein DBV15_09639 [Temnothorax longispinosus]